VRLAADVERIVLEGCVTDVLVIVFISRVAPFPSG
jgi:hypothetical protein